MKRLSIIVPIYNVESYIEKCLRSIEDQDIDRNDYEIICINDGSSDKSGEVVQELQKEFDNIILINQENQGVSVARNNGIDIANGEYLIMIDADDFIQKNILKKNLNILKKYDLDVAFTGYTILDETSKEEYSYDPIYDANNVLTGIEFIKKYRRGKLNLIERDPHRSAGIFFRRFFFNSNNLRYLSDVPFLEDGELMTRIMCLAKRVIFINGSFYMRTTRPGSATQSKLYYSEKARNGFLKSANNLVQFKQKYCKNKSQKKIINSSIIHFTIVSIISMETFEYFKYYSQMYRALKKGPLKKLETEGCSPWYRKMGNYYNCSIHCFYLYWLIYRFRKSFGIKLNKLF